MTKRANGEGNVRKRTDGRWEARFTYADAATGEIRRGSAYGKTQAEVRAKMKEKQGRAEEGKPVNDSRQTLAAFTQGWIETTLRASDRKATTKATYGILARKHIQNAPIGAIALDKLRAKDVEAMVLLMQEAGLASSTVRQTYTVLRAILDAAVRDHYVARNVAALVKRPAVERVEARSLESKEVKAVLAGAEGSRYSTLLSLLSRTGLRRGEALALRWQDVDLDGGELRVRGTLGRVGGELIITEPKTDLSRRAVTISPSTVELLRKHRAAQAAERLRAGELWADRGLVFATETGGPVDPRNALRALTTAAKKAGVESIGLHTLRHSAASTMLSAGVPLTDVSRMLGHSSVAITGDIYGHVSTDGQKRAAELLAAALD
ncbi:tyrosine-type recombinase/integrase [Agromyces sp. NPDC056965]|uniref:tyrosine-type recombinase/integrase n=1 Tax=Agromyces sp. NPDC056965 TaxID=3345983 RepID=UPI00362FC62E